MNIDPWLRDRLACPRDHQRLVEREGALTCAGGHRYPVVDGVPVLLLDDVPQTLGTARASLDLAIRGAADGRAANLYLESVEISDEEKRGVLELASQQPAIDPVVSYLVAATNGLMYRHLRGRLSSYPIPEIDLPEGNGRALLDVGCSWGRWTIAAARRGYRAVGIDPSLGAVMAARRVARDLNVPSIFVVGDARYLPFAGASFDTIFSYSVLQHFSRQDAARAAGDIGRVLTANGVAKVQMPTRFGVRCLYHQARRGFSDGAGFDVRYWSVGELRRLFTERIGRTRISVEGYFGIGLQQTDAHLMTTARRAVLGASHWMTSASRRMPWLTAVADSVYVEAVKA
ncbi:MAG TPA: methyltransferase domain-containing protein [Vicinamibacterales bacterium]|nr:methyltransferase domain-containing protein [Vicinamibacterales bacterium]